jgi:hypothetical protein
LLNLTELIPAVNSTFVAEPSGKIAPHPNKGPALLLPMASKVVKSRSICRIVKGKIPKVLSPLAVITVSEVPDHHINAGLHDYIDTVLKIPAHAVVSGVRCAGNVLNIRNKYIMHRCDDRRMVTRRSGRISGIHMHVGRAIH